MGKTDNQFIEISNSGLYVMIMSLAKFSIVQRERWSFR